MSQIHFFALEPDIRAVLESVERLQPLTYIETGNRLDDRFATFRCAADLPGLGIADSATGGMCTTYMAADAGQSFVTRTLVGDKGVTRHLMDQLVNPGTVVLRAAGRWKSGIVLAGTVSTACTSAKATRIMRYFRTAFEKSFTSVNGCLVGPEAMKLFRVGTRFAFAEQSPLEFDLREGA